jgi:hypothetical protein
MSYRDLMTRDAYGVTESNPISAEFERVREEADETVDLTDRRLAKITRLRLVGDRGFPLLDLSYCYGELKDGTPVRVSLPEFQFPKRGLERALVGMCKSAGVYGKGLGILDPDVISVLV